MSDTLDRNVIRALLTWTKRVGYRAPDNQFKWYAMTASKVQPDSYLEIGVWHGFSAMATLFGWPHIERMTLVDNESRDVTLEQAKQNIVEFCETIKHEPPEFELLKVDSTTLTTLPGTDEFDMAHIDGDHTYEGAYNDTELAFQRLSRRGLMIIDDMETQAVREGIYKFERAYPGIITSVLPSHRGHRLIWRA